MKNKVPLLLLISIFFFILFFGGSKKSEENAELSYEGITFKYPSYWKVEPQQIIDKHYYISCSEKFSSNTIFLVSCLLIETNSEEFVKNHIKSLEDNFSVMKEPLTTGKFGKYDCISVKYKVLQLKDKAYGIAYAFNYEGKTILVVKQSKREYELKHKKYKLMEDSSTIEESIENTPNKMIASEISDYC